MTHLEVEHLASDYLEGQLDAASQAEMQRHLAGCNECRAMIEDVGRALEMCRSAEDLLPPPWLVPKILRLTLGERKPGLRERIAGLLQQVKQPRLAYTLAMALFSFSVLINAAGLDLRKLTVQDLNPRTWIYRADREGHLIAARAEKFYYDLRLVYEIESRFRDLRSQPSGPEKIPQRQVAPPGGTTDQTRPSDPQLAWVENPRPGNSSAAAPGRSPSR